MDLFGWFKKKKKKDKPETAIAQSHSLKLNPGSVTVIGEINPDAFSFQLFSLDNDGVIIPGSVVNLAFFDSLIPLVSIAAGGYELRLVNRQMQTVTALRFAKINTQRDTLWVRYKGKVPGLNRGNNYESYATGMIEPGRTSLWFAGSPADKIFYASRASDEETFETSWQSVLTPDPNSLDSGLTADPSVVFWQGKYLMAYTATPNHSQENRNSIFLATSSDRTTWTRLGKDGSQVAYPVLFPTDSETGYGIGQSSLIVARTDRGEKLWHYYSDTSANNAAGRPGCHRATHDASNIFDVSPDVVTGIGDYTWDMKQKADGGVVGVVALFGEKVKGNDGKLRRYGGLRFATSASDGLTFSEAQYMPATWLIDDHNLRCLNNGGWIGTPEGRVPGTLRMEYVCAAGYQTNGDPKNEWPGKTWPPKDWDLVSFEVFILPRNRG